MYFLYYFFVALNQPLNQAKNQFQFFFRVCSSCEKTKTSHPCNLVFKTWCKSKQLVFFIVQIGKKFFGIWRYLICMLLLTKKLYCRPTETKGNNNSICLMCKLISSFSLSKIRNYNTNSVNNDGGAKKGREKDRNRQTDRQTDDSN